MRLWRWLVPLAALLLAGPPAGAASPPRLGVATPTDERPRRAVTEQWRLRVDDPRSPRTVELRMTPFYIEIRRFDLDSRRSREAKLYVAPTRYEPGRLRFAGPDGNVVVRHRRTSVELRIDHRLATGTVTLRRVARGPRFDHWSFAAGPGHPSGTLRWAMPVATSVAAGAVRFEGGRDDVTGWRGSYMHLWGSLDLEWSSWDHVQTFVSHEPGGAATVLMGVAESFRPERTRRDALWKAVLAYATPDRTRVCRPRVRRGRWREGVFFSGIAQEAAAGGCRGVPRAEFVVSDAWFLGGRGFTDGYDEVDGFLRGSRRGRGWTLQFSHG